jgi:ubiquinone/menaquinone biosynthesis C-methylase UbiE
MAEEHSYYIIRGGAQGRERLRVLARVLQPYAIALFEQAGVTAGMHCLDIGCGGGDLTLDLARIVGASGRVVGTDVDPKKLEIARAEAQDQHLRNTLFELEDITEGPPGQTFDVVHARFVLTHLPDPESAVANMRSAVRPGGILMLQDIDFQGHSCHPENSAFARYLHLYAETVRRRGGDPNIGPRLTGFLTGAGLANVQTNSVQPAGTDGEVKLIAALTMENIADAVIAEGMALKPEVDELIDALYDLAKDRKTLVTLPRIFQVWGYRT